MIIGAFTVLGFAGCAALLVMGASHDWKSEGASLAHISESQALSTPLGVSSDALFQSLGQPDSEKTDIADPSLTDCEYLTSEGGIALVIVNQMGVVTGCRVLNKDDSTIRKDAGIEASSATMMVISDSSFAEERSGIITDLRLHRN
jgi:hypothetical protein